MVSPEVVMFAIRGALQLYGAGRRAYIDGTRGRPLTLPLPRAPGIQFDSAHSWFTIEEDGIEATKRFPRIQRLVNLPAPTGAEKAELVDLYLALRAEFDPGWTQGAGIRGQFTSDQLSSLLEIRQWADGEFGQPPTALQQVAGTLVNLAVDYFAYMPGAVSPERPAGRALLAFLRAIDDTDFANTPVTDVAGELMIAVLDAVAETPELAGAGEKELLLVENISRTMASSAKQYLAHAPTTERWEAATWLRLATRALVKGGADTVLGNPVLFLDVKAGAEANIVTQVGKTVADLLVGDDRLTFRRLLSGEGVSTIVRSSLDAVAKNPDILKIDHDGLKKLLVAIAADVAQVEGTLGPDLFPEVARLILENSAENLDVLWGKDFQTPERHLLVTASRAALAALAAPPPAGSKWTPRFSRGQVVEVLESVFDEVVDNPEWLVAHAGSDSPLGAAVEAMLASMRQLDGNRISAGAGVVMLQAGLKAVAVRLPLLDTLPTGGADSGRVVLTAALDAIFAELFRDGLGADAQWQLARNSVIVGVVEVGLGKLAKAGARQEHIDALRAAARSLAEGSGPINLEAFAADLETHLAAA